MNEPLPVPYSSTLLHSMIKVRTACVAARMSFFSRSFLPSLHLLLGLVWARARHSATGVMSCRTATWVGGWCGNLIKLPFFLFFFWPSR
ncbi:hypothetical protein HOY80DRAFT_969764 [Tuber brumale]|nr:hypothetical protein HOY80DRAFT_969764 [Tuber brumale]